VLLSVSQPRWHSRPFAEWLAPGLAAGEETGEPGVGESRDPLSQLLQQESRLLLVPPQVSLGQGCVLGSAHPQHFPLERDVHDGETLIEDSLRVRACQS
jgi:RES domain-containing protein